MTTGRINQVCASPLATLRVYAQVPPSGCQQNVILSSHAKQPSFKMIAARFRNLRPDTRRIDAMEGPNALPKASRSEGFRKALIRECLRHALQYSLSLNTHKGPISKAANTAPTNDLSLITMPTKTQCVLIGKEQD